VTEVLALTASAAGLWAGGTDGLAFLPYPDALGDTCDAPGCGRASAGWRAPVSALHLAGDGRLLIGGVDTIARLAPLGTPAPQRPQQRGMFTPACQAASMVPERAGTASGGVGRPASQPGAAAGGAWPQRTPKAGQAPCGHGRTPPGDDAAPAGASPPSRPFGAAVEPARVPGAVGPVSAFAAMPDGTLLAATLGDGVVRSTDGGGFWKRSGFGLASPEVSCLWVAADGTPFAGTAAGVHRARAGGRAWQPCPGSQDAPVAAITQLPDGEGLLAVTEDGRTLRCAAGGEHWTSRDGAPRGATALLAVDSGLLLATAGRGVYHSPDAGATWIPAPPHPAVRTVHCLAATPRALYAGTDGGVAVSRGAGLPWGLLQPTNATLCPSD
jgi:hypothetical protein